MAKVQMREQYVARGHAGLAWWHKLLRQVTFVCALVLMALSLVALHWALVLVGIPPVLAWIGPVFLEAGMAATASAATTIRKPSQEPGAPGRYYLSLWVIFSFLMALAQAANIGHAIVSAETRLATLPEFVPDAVVYGFAAAFAALFPLGGTLFIHVSGFLRAHSIDANWIDDDAQVVRVAADDRVQQPRAPKAAPRAQTPPAPRAPDMRAPAQPRVHNAPEPARTTAPVGGEQVRARELFDAQVAENPTIKPDASLIHRELATDKNPATVRRWVKDWWDEQQTAAEPAHDPIADQLPTPVSTPQRQTA